MRYLRPLRNRKAACQIFITECGTVIGEPGYYTVKNA
jgi:hypothetical protein